MADGQRLVLLGDPVDHSRSPVIHMAALAAAGIAGHYTARRVDESGMVAAALSLRSGELTGENITMPHKRKAMELADTLSDTAARAGVVNTWVAQNGRIEGHNTDVAGVARAFGVGQFDDDVPILILGNGGAAAAACLAFEHRLLFVAGRRGDAVTAMLDRIGVAADVVDWLIPVPGAVVVNATPIGMHGEPLPQQLLDSASGLIDMTYGEVRSPAITAAVRSGITAVEGREMLLGQAIESFALWTGVAAPEVAMRSALGI